LGPDNDQYDRPSEWIGSHRYETILTDAVLVIVLFDMKKIALLVTQDDLRIVERHRMFFQVLDCLFAIPFELLMKTHSIALVERLFDVSRLTAAFSYSGPSSP
jgi:hypothetical protein